MDWTRERTLQLIEEIEIRPTIWNIPSKEYKHKIRRQDGIKEIADIFKTTPEMIEKKISVLRTQYSREKRKVERSQRSGASVNDVYETKWFAYKPMAFMVGSILNCPETNMKTGNDILQLDELVPSLNENSVSVPEEDLTKDDFNEITEEHQNLNVHEEKPKEIASQSIPKKRKRKVREKYIYDDFFIEACSTLREIRRNKCTSEEEKKDEFDVFGASIAFQLRKLKTGYGKSLAKFNIQKALFEAETWEQKNQNK